MGYFSIVGQIYQFQLIETIKYDDDTLNRHDSNTFNNFQNFTAFTGGSAGPFSGLILLRIVIFRQFNAFNDSNLSFNSND